MPTIHFVPISAQFPNPLLSDWLCSKGQRGLTSLYIGEGALAPSSALHIHQGWVPVARQLLIAAKTTHT